MLEIQGVHFEYPVFNGKIAQALNDISLTIKPGELVAIIGPNGSGKSTLARHLNALLVPDEGWVKVNGLRTDFSENKWYIRRTVGLVFQNPENQVVAPLVEEDVAFGPENLGIPADEISRRVEQALGAVGLADFRRKPVDDLSGGQKQRVAIAGILALKPEYIVLDEPTAMLDPAGREEVLRVLESLCRQESIAVVLVTHLLEEITMADRVLLMDRGRIVRDERPVDILTRRSLLRSMGLELPSVNELAYFLSCKGYAVPRDIATVEDMVGWLCTLDWKV